MSAAALGTSGNCASWGATGLVDTGAPCSSTAGSNALGTYIVQTATNAPANAQIMATLATGIVKSTTGTGVQSIAVAADFPTLNQNTTGSAATFTGAVAGDVTGTQNAHVVARINGTTVPINTAADQAVVTTASATGAWTALPACLDSGGQHLNYNTTTHAFACGTSGGTAGSAAFNTVTTGTNTQAAMTVGAGASVVPTSATVGVVSANQLNGTSLSTLATGILKNTTATGAPSIAVAADIPLTAAVVQTGQSNTYTTGTQDFSAAAHTLPMLKGTIAGKPATCTIGELYFATDATAGQNIYQCAATNVWTQQLNAGGTPIHFSGFPDKSYFPAANCNSTTPGAGWSIPTAAAATVNCHTATNVNDGVVSFADGNSAQLSFLLPDDWDATSSLDAALLLTNVSITGTVIMQVATSCSATGGTQIDDQVFNAAQAFSTITLTTPSKALWRPTLTGLTKTGCIAGSFLHMQISRGVDTATNVSDISGLQLTVRRTF
ncbi:MAG: hypothetical protein NVS9B4_00920 [Candidatus Acidiferrum sp.]